MQAEGECHDGRSRGSLTSAFGWEQHCCLPLEADCDIAPLRRYLDVGTSYLSVNVGYAPHDIEATMRVISSWRRQIRDDDSGSFQLATSVADVRRGQARPDGWRSGSTWRTPTRSAATSRWCRPTTTSACGRCC